MASNHPRAGCDTPCMWLFVLVLVPRKGSPGEAPCATQQRLPTICLVPLRFGEKGNTISAFSWIFERKACGNLDLICATPSSVQSKCLTLERT